VRFPFLFNVEPDEIARNIAVVNVGVCGLLFRHAASMQARLYGPVHPNGLEDDIRGLDAQIQGSDVITPHRCT
jgi:hypothetical protein